MFKSLLIVAVSLSVMAPAQAATQAIIVVRDGSSQSQPGANVQMCDGSVRGASKSGLCDGSVRTNGQFLNYNGVKGEVGDNGGIHHALEANPSGWGDGTTNCSNNLHQWQTNIFARGKRNPSDQGRGYVVETNATETIDWGDRVGHDGLVTELPLLEHGLKKPVLDNGQISPNASALSDQGSKVSLNPQPLPPMPATAPVADTVQPAMLVPAVRQPTHVIVPAVQFTGGSGFTGGVKIQ